MKKACEERRKIKETLGSKPRKATREMPQDMGRGKIPPKRNFSERSPEG